MSVISTKRRILNSFFWSSFSRVAGGALKFFTTPLLLSYLGKEHFGLLALALSINVYMQIMELGFNTGNIRFISRWLAEEKVDRVLRLVKSSMFFYGLVGIVNVILLILLCFFSKQIFGLTQEQAELFRSMIIVLIVSSFISWTWSISTQVLRGYEKIAFDERLNLLTSLLTFGAVLFTIYCELTLIQYFMLYGFSIISIYPIRVWKCRSINNDIKFVWGWDSEIFNEVLKYSLGIFAMSFFQFSARNLRPLIIGIRASVNSVADYNILLQVTSLIVIFSGSVLGVLLPYVTRALSLGDEQVLRQIVYKGTKYLSVIVSYLVFGLMVIAKPLLILYVGEDYGDLSIWLMLWSLAMLSYHNGALAALVLSGSNIRPLAYYSAFSASISLLAAWIFVPFYDLGGAVISILLYSISQMLFYYFYYIPVVLKMNALQLFLNSFIIPVIIGLICAIITKYVTSVSLFNTEVEEIVLNGFAFSVMYFLLTSIFVLKLNELKEFV